MEKQESVTEPKLHEFNLIVNSRDKKWDKDQISYKEVIILDSGTYIDDDTVEYTVTYNEGPKQNPKGEMDKGDVVFVKNGMRFYVTKANKS